MLASRRKKDIGSKRCFSPLVMLPFLVLLLLWVVPGCAHVLPEGQLRDRVTQVGEAAADAADDMPTWELRVALLAIAFLATGYPVGKLWTYFKPGNNAGKKK